MTPLKKRNFWSSTSSPLRQWSIWDNLLHLYNWDVDLVKTVVWLVSVQQHQRQTKISRVLRHTHSFFLVFVQPVSTQ